MDSGLIKELLKLAAAFGVGYALASSTKSDSSCSVENKPTEDSPKETTTNEDVIVQKPAGFTVIENPKESIPQFVSPVTIDPTTTSPVASN